MSAIDMIRELDRLYLVAKATDKAADWAAYFAYCANVEAQYPDLRLADERRRA